jgi:hypothetical protein
MTIKTLTVIHEALHMQLERQKMELEVLTRDLEKNKANGEPPHVVGMSERIVKSSSEELKNIRRAIDEFEAASFSVW